MLIHPSSSAAIVDKCSILVRNQPLKTGRYDIRQQAFQVSTANLLNLTLVANKNWHYALENSGSMFELKVELLASLLEMLQCPDRTVFDGMIAIPLKKF